MKRLVLIITSIAIIFLIGCNKEDDSTKTINLENDNIVETQLEEETKKEEDLKFYLPERMFVVMKSIVSSCNEALNTKEGNELATLLKVSHNAMDANLKNMNSYYPTDIYANELNDIIEPCIETLKIIDNNYEKGITDISKEALKIYLSSLDITEVLLEQKIKELEIDESIINYK